MNFRPAVSLPIVFITIAALGYLGSSHSVIPIVHAQDPASNASGAPISSVHKKIELSEIRLAIRLQEVQIAKAERRLLTRGTEDADEVLKAKKQELIMVEDELSRTRRLYEEGSVGLESVSQAENMRQATAAVLAAYESKNAASADKIAVHDEKIKLLGLRVELAKTKLDQLRRQLK